MSLFITYNGIECNTHYVHFSNGRPVIQEPDFEEMQGGMQCESAVVLHQYTNKHVYHILTRTWSDWLTAVFIAPCKQIFQVTYILLN